MTLPTSGKALRQRRSKIVAVIASQADLRRALRLRLPPDYFEIRLDCTAGSANAVEESISDLPAPAIITARHPREGGANNLTATQRRDLLMRFLPYAKIIDVELRSVKGFQSLLKAARGASVECMISVHNFRTTPRERLLRQKAQAAKTLGADIFKIAVRTDKQAQLARLLAFIASKNVGLPIAAMGIGELGAISRVLLAQLGSALIYTSIGRARIRGQLSLEQWRAAARVFRLR